METDLGNYLYAKNNFKLSDTKNFDDRIKII